MNLGRCGTCKYVSLPPDAKPCDSCTWGQGDIDRFEASAPAEPETDAGVTWEQIPKYDTAEPKGVKHDQGKPEWHLLPWRQVERVVNVLGDANQTKYRPNSWKENPEPYESYFNAAMRHIVAWRMGEKIDKDSGEHHLAHAVCCLLFLMWFDDRDSP